MKIAKEHILILLKKIYFAVLICFFVVFFGVSVITTNLLWSGVALLGLFVFAVVVKKAGVVLEWTRNNVVPYIIYVVTFLIRFVYCIFILPFINQISDFKIVADEAASGLFIDNLDYYRFYFHKFFYPYLLRLLSLNTQTKIIIFQCFVVAWIPVILYLIGKRISRSDVGFIAAFIYIVWPSLIVYTQIATEEHISALVTTLIVYCFICIYQRIEKIEVWSVSVVYVFAIATVTGVLCGIAAYSKDWALVILCAAVICAFYQIIRSNRIQILVMLISLLLLLGGRSVFDSMVKNVGENILGVSPNNGVISMQMYETLDPNSNGEYNLTLNEEYMNMAADNNYDFELTNSMAKSILLDKIKKDYNKMPALLSHKATEAYRSNESFFGWALDKETNDVFKQRYDVLVKVIKKIDQLMYVTCFILLIISVVISRNKYLFFLQLITLGGALVNLIVECQQRYKYSIMSVWCIPIAYAVIWIMDKAKSEKEM